MSVLILKLTTRYDTDVWVNLSHARFLLLDKEQNLTCIYFDNEQHTLVVKEAPGRIAQLATEAPVAYQSFRT